jgi:hypothetical protein
MNPNSAYKLVTIEPGKVYVPNNLYGKHGYIQPELENTEHDKRPQVFLSKTSPIFAVWCVESSGDGMCTFECLGNSEPITVPSKSFRQGVVYYMFFKRLLDDDKGRLKLVGYQYHTHPPNLPTSHPYNPGT